MTFIIILAIIILIVFLFIFYRVKYDTVIAFTGGLGSGKSLKSCMLSLKLLKRNRSKVRFENFKIKIKNKFFKANLSRKELPYLYASIPVVVKSSWLSFKTYNCVLLTKNGYQHYSKQLSYLGYKVSDKPFISKLHYLSLNINKKYVKRFIEMAVELTDDYLLLQSKLNYKSIVFIDEVGSFASQFEYRNPNILGAFNEFVRLFRHYTKGGYLIVNDQCSENIVLEIRRRINTVFNLMHFKKWFFFFYTVKIRNINISEEIKTIEEDNSEDNMSTLFGIMPFTKHYDTYCYSDRYNSVPRCKSKHYKKLKKNTLLKVGSVYKTPLTTNSDE